MLGEQGGQGPPHPNTLGWYVEEGSVVWWFSASSYDDNENSKSFSGCHLVMPAFCI